VKYKSFLPPGGQIEYTVEAKTIADNVSSFTAAGVSDDRTVVEAKIALRHFNLADRDPRMAATDAKIIEQMKLRWKLICP